ncbi:MAG: HAD family hydrolase [Myxococcota bacterium]
MATPEPAGPLRIDVVQPTERRERLNGLPDPEGALADLDGPPPRLDRWIFRLQGLVGAQEARRVERRLRDLPSVREARVELRRSLLTVSTVDCPHDPAFIAALLADESIGATFLGTPATRKRPAMFARAARRSLIVGVLGLAAAVVHDPHLGLVDPGAQGRAIALNVQALFALALVGWAARPAWLDAFRRVGSERPAPEAFSFAVGLGALAFAFTAFLVGGAPDFGPGLVLVTGTVVLVGHGRRVHEAARAPLRDVDALLPADAWVLRREGLFALDAAAVTSGEVVLVDQGMVIPADGIVVAGAARLEGRSVLVGQEQGERSDGDHVWAGMRVAEGRLAVRVRSDRHRSSVARIAALLDVVGEDDPWVRQHVRRAIRWMAGASVVAAVGVAAGRAWWERWASDGSPGSTGPLEAGAAVLLAAGVVGAARLWDPVMVAVMGAAVERGILFRDAESVDSAAALDEVVFDKTGTVTVGEPEVVRWIVTPEFERDRALAIVLALHEGDVHPVAEALVAHARHAICDSNVEVGLNQRKDLVGLGATGRLEDGTQIRLGNARLMERSGVDVSTIGEQPPTVWEGKQARSAEDLPPTRMYLARGHEAVACFELIDPLREGMDEALGELAARRLDLALVADAGDDSAAEAADRVGIPIVEAELAGAQLVEWVASRCEARDRHVAVVAHRARAAALRRVADLGVAFGTGLRVGALDDEVTLIAADPDALVSMRRLATRARRTVRRGRLLLVLYTVGVVGAAALGRLGLLAAAVAPLGLGLAMAWTGTAPFKGASVGARRASGKKNGPRT